MPRRPTWRVNGISRASSTGASSMARRLGRFDALPQNALELLRIVRVRELSGARQMEVIEARQPEAQCGGAQQRGPLRMLVRIERPHRFVRAYELFAAVRVERAAVVDDAPVVGGDGEVVSEEVGRGEAEIDDPGD